MKAIALRINLWGVAALAGVAVLWHAVALRYASPLFPGPLDVISAAMENLGTIETEIGATLSRAAIAFAIAVCTMVPLGLACGRIKALGALVDPLLEFLAAVPPPAVIPLVMLFAGVGDGAKITVIVFAIFPLILINTMEGARETAPMLTRVAKSFQMSRLEQMLLIDLPSAMPAIFVGLRLAVATSMLVSITSEMILATDGIGTFLQRSQEGFEIAASLAGLFSISLVGFAINFGFRLSERKFLFWFYRGQA